MRDHGRLVVSIHDVAPATGVASRSWVDALERRGVAASLLVVPGPWKGHPLTEDAELVAWLRTARDVGHEIAQHGWVHAAGPEGGPVRRAIGQVVARGCAEFWALDEQEARSRLQRGRAVLWRAGLDPIGFTPPGWLASGPTRRALRSLGYRYGTDHAGVYDLVAHRRHLTPALSSRPGGAAEWIGRRTMIAAARRLASIGGVVRVALHPADWHDPCLRTAALLAIDAALEAGARPCTYAELVTRRAPARGLLPAA